MEKLHKDEVASVGLEFLGQVLGATEAPTRGDVLDRMRRAAAKFRIDKVRQEDIVRAGGAPEEEEE